MRALTALKSKWKAEDVTGDNLHLELCKGGYGSTIDEYGLKVVGKTAQDTIPGDNIYDTPNMSTTNVTADILSKDSNGFVAQQNAYGKRDQDTNNPTLAGTSQYCGGWIGVPANDHGADVVTISFDITFTDIYGTDEISTVWNMKPYVRFTGESVDKFYYFNAQVGKTTHVSITHSGGYRSIIFTCNSCKITVKNLIVTPGTEEKPWVPYVGGVPSPNPKYPQPFKYVPQGTKLDILGKNLIDSLKSYTAYHQCTVMSTSTNGFVVKMADNAANTYPGTTNNSSGWYSIPCNVRGTFTISFDVIYSDPVGATDTVNAPWIALIYDQGETYHTFGRSSMVAAGKQHISLTLTTNISNKLNYIRWSLNSCTVTVENLMVVADETEAPWVPYIHGGTLTTPCDIFEGDIWHPMTGKVKKKNRSFVLTGQERVYYYRSNEFYIIKDNLHLTREDEYSITVYSNYFKGISRNDIFYNGTDMAMATSNGYIRFTYNDLMVYNDDGTLNTTASCDNFKAFFKTKYDAGTPVVVVSKNNEYTEQYDPQPFFLPKGTVNILQVSKDLEADLNMTAIVKR